MFAVNAELPPTVQRRLPPAAQTHWRNVANGELAKGVPPTKAFLKSWQAVTEGWELGPDGHYVRSFEKATPRTLYVRRDLKNGDEFVKWAKAQGFATTVPKEDLHVTVLYSKRPVDWMKMGTNWSGDSKGVLTVPSGGPRIVEPLGTGGAVVLLFSSDELTWRHRSMVEAGASSDFDGYQAHVTITWDAQGVDLSKVEPYTGQLVFGPEIFEEINEDWKAGLVEKADYEKLVTKFRDVTGDEVRVVKVDSGLGLVFGWAVVCKHQGKDYFDLNRDRATGELVPEHVPEGAMLEAAADFMENSRVAKEMHQGDAQGTVVFAFPMTSDIAKSLNIDTKGTTGLLIAMKPSPAMLAKYQSGEYTGFSIGGSREKIRELVEV